MGEFVGLTEAQQYTRSRLFSGRPLAVTARFSLPGGNPAASDTARNTLTISSVATQKDAPCSSVNFDPLVLSDGIQPTSDPVLLARSPAYAISFGKRMAGE